MGSPYSKDHWKPDEEATHCQKCEKEFNFTRRRHHCRKCGGVFCSTCCFRKAPIPSFEIYEPVRMCDVCYALLVVCPPTELPHRAKHSNNSSSALRLSVLTSTQIVANANGSPTAEIDPVNVASARQPPEAAQLRKLCAAFHPINISTAVSGYRLHEVDFSRNLFEIASPNPRAEFADSEELARVAAESNLEVLLLGASKAPKCIAAVHREALQCYNEWMCAPAAVDAELVARYKGASPLKNGA